MSAGPHMNSTCDMHVLSTSSACEYSACEWSGYLQKEKQLFVISLKAISALIGGNCTTWPCNNFALHTAALVIILLLHTRTTLRTNSTFSLCWLEWNVPFNNFAWYTSHVLQFCCYTPQDLFCDHKPITSMINAPEKVVHWAHTNPRVYLQINCYNYMAYAVMLHVYVLLIW